MRMSLVLSVLAFVGPASAQQAGHGDHQMHQHSAEASPMHAEDPELGATAAPRDAGQSAFGAIQEIVTLLQADPATDWSRVNIDVLRQHLVDMDNVTLRSTADRTAVTGGYAFTVVSDDRQVAASIQRMVIAHVAVMDGVKGMDLTAEPRPDGAVLTATGPADLVSALGFYGIMALGMHHQAHHLALAQGADPHAH
ncbi:hypothetical protein [Thalassovita sp.]|uniref:hypothetical protein n=1 Tax=Thalassovita sp. TaxID=1979401 RepID=UPI0029DE51C8|nr:hypothetical protein [Thalassovita sp.]